MKKFIYIFFLIILSLIFVEDCFAYNIETVEANINLYDTIRFNMASTTFNYDFFLSGVNGFYSDFLIRYYRSTSTSWAIMESYPLRFDIGQVDNCYLHDNPILCPQPYYDNLGVYVLADCNNYGNAYFNVNTKANNEGVSLNYNIASTSDPIELEDFDLCWYFYDLSTSTQRYGLNWHSGGSTSYPINIFLMLFTREGYNSLGTNITFESAWDFLTDYILDEFYQTIEELTYDKGGYIIPPGSITQLGNSIFFKAWLETLESYSQNFESDYDSEVASSTLASAFNGDVSFTFFNWDEDMATTTSFNIFTMMGTFIDESTAFKMRAVCSGVLWLLLFLHLIRVVQSIFNGLAGFGNVSETYSLSSTGKSSYSITKRN